ncbi:putative leucine-rich repeat domain superfamily [Helianthus debilis subsp. tardiflorus]
MNDTAAAAVASCRSLERLWLTRCKGLSDIGIGCVAVGCLKLRVLSLKWCLGVGDLGVALIGVKCKQIRSLDLSHLLVFNTSLNFDTLIVVGLSSSVCHPLNLCILWTV